MIPVFPEIALTADAFDLKKLETGPRHTRASELHRFLDLASRYAILRQPEASQHEWQWKNTVLELLNEAQKGEDVTPEIRQACQKLTAIINHGDFDLFWSPRVASEPEPISREGWGRAIERAAKDLSLIHI